MSLTIQEYKDVKHIEAVLISRLIQSNKGRS